LCWPSAFPATTRKSNKPQTRPCGPPHEIELEILGFSHAEDGAYLLALWGLPYPIVEAVAFHHNPGAALKQGLELTTTVSVANALVDEIMRSRPFTMANHLETLGLTRELPRWTALPRRELPAIVPALMAQ
jgi:HD-like signal output (HDOD) protein